MQVNNEMKDACVVCGKEGYWVVDDDEGLPLCDDCNTDMCKER